MDEEPKKEHKLPSMLEMSEMFDKVQSQMNPLSYNFEKLNSVQGIASQYEHLNPATSIADIVGKAVQPVDFASVNVVNHSALANCDQLRISEAMAYNLADTSSLMSMASQYEHLNSAASIADITSKAVKPVDFSFLNIVDHSALAECAQLRIPEAMALQDGFLEMTKGMSAYDSIMSMRENMIHSVGGANIYENMLASANLVRDSVEPYRSAFDVARTLFEANEPFKLAIEIQSQAFISDSLSSKYSSVFEQLESLRNLESFKAISRLENFPNDKVWTQDYDKGREITEDFLAEATNIDASISEEVSSVDDFNKFTEERRTILLNLYRDHYYPVILNCLIMLLLWKSLLDRKINLSKNTFVFVKHAKNSLCYIGINNYRPSLPNILDAIIVNLLFQIFF